jgi:hypothetical protein
LRARDKNDKRKWEKTLNEFIGRTQKLKKSLKRRGAAVAKSVEHRKCARNIEILYQITPSDNLRIIFKTGVLYLKKVNLEDLFTLSIRHPIQNIDGKNFVRSYVNAARGVVFTTLHFLCNL